MFVSQVFVHPARGVDPTTLDAKVAERNVRFIQSSDQLSGEEKVKQLSSLLMRVQVDMRLIGTDASNSEARAEVARIYQEGVDVQRARNILQSNPIASPAALEQMRSIPTRICIDSILWSASLDVDQKSAWLGEVRSRMLSTPLSELRASPSPSGSRPAAPYAYSPLEGSSLTPDSLAQHPAFKTFCQDAQIDPAQAEQTLAQEWPRIRAYAAHFESARAKGSGLAPRGDSTEVGLACALSVVQERLGAGFEAAFLLSKIVKESQFESSAVGGTGAGWGQITAITVKAVRQELDTLNTILTNADRPTLADSTANSIQPKTGKPVAFGGPKTQAYKDHLSDPGHNLALMTATLLLKMSETPLRDKSPSDLGRKDLHLLLKRYRGAKSDATNEAYAKSVLSIYDSIKKVKYE